MFAELKRRRVFGAVAAYVVLAALLIELSGAIFEALLLPDWSARLVTVLLILGLPVVAVLSWFFDISMGGIERTAESQDPSRRGGEPLGAALRRAGAAPVPETPARRRRAVAPESATGAALDPARVREAALGHIRHELRTPINGILGYTEMVLEDVADETLAADLERIREAGRRLLERVDAVLLREGAGGDDTDDLESFAEKVRLDLRTPISAVVGYAEILIESCEEAGREELLGDLERILRSARRLLEVSEDIVRMATDPAGAGAEFAETAVVTEQLLSRIRPLSAAGTPEGEGRLLVVDDNETNRDLISRQLARFGYTVATASDGLEALDRLKHDEFDLVLLDVIMPGLDGVETLVRLREEERLADTPVIMLSSLNELDSAVRCIAMGATDYIAKPVEPTLLEARIAAALEVRDLRSRERVYRRRVEADADLIDRLLGGAFPDFVLDRVRDGALEIRESYPEATVVRAVYPAELRPSSGPDALDRIGSAQDAARTVESLVARHRADGVFWRPDGFLTVHIGGNGRDAPATGAELALAVRDRLEGVAVGVHAGPVVAGVLGEARPRFEVWGEAVESAEALAGHAAAGTVLVTPAVRSALGDAFGTTPRGVKEIRGRGQMRVYSLVTAGEGETPVPAG